MRQDAVRRVRNRSTKANLRSQLRKVRAAISEKKLDESVAEFKTLITKLDKAGQVEMRLVAAGARGCPHEVAAVGCD